MLDRSVAQTKEEGSLPDMAPFWMRTGAQDTLPQ
jgi:hypothetical protein